MTYQRNIICLGERPAGLKDGLDDRVPDRVEQPEIGARDHDEPDDDGGALAHLAAVRPLHAAQLGPRGAQEVRGPAEEALARMRRLALHLAGALAVPGRADVRRLGALLGEA